MAAEGVSFSVLMYYSELIWGSTYTESQSYTVLDLVGFNQFSYDWVIPNEIHLPNEF